MRDYSLSHLRDPELRRSLECAIKNEGASIVTSLIHIAEYDARKLYLPDAYPSMYDYCVHGLHLPEDSALKRIRAARTARRFPVIFEALEEGRLHLSGVVMLTPHLTPENAEELLAAAVYKTKAEIKELLAHRFPRPETLAMVQVLPAAAIASNLHLGPGQAGSGDSGQLAPGPVEATTRPKVTPLSPERVAFQFTGDRGMQEDLRYAQALLGHTVPSGDVAHVFGRALKALIREQERQKFGATSRPRRGGGASSNPRHIPARVKRAVWERDGGQCTFTSETGRRCPATKLLEFDHVEEVARGGQASVGGIRLRCRAHNQYTAERTFGAGFMRHKREEVRRHKAEARARAAIDEVIAPLRQLGYSAAEARCAAALCESIPDAPLEQRVRRALSCFLPPHRKVAAVAGGSEPAP